MSRTVYDVSMQCAFQGGPPEPERQTMQAPSLPVPNPSTTASDDNHAVSSCSILYQYIFLWVMPRFSYVLLLYSSFAMQTCVMKCLFLQGTLLNGHPVAQLAKYPLVQEQHAAALDEGPHSTGADAAEPTANAFCPVDDL
jgi:hypothetical protein